MGKLGVRSRQSGPEGLLWALQAPLSGAGQVRLAGMLLAQWGRMASAALPWSGSSRSLEVEFSPPSPLETQQETTSCRWLQLGARCGHAQWCGRTPSVPAASSHPALLPQSLLLLVLAIYRV